MRKRHKLSIGLALLLLGVGSYSAWRWHQPEAKSRRQIENWLKVPVSNSGESFMTADEALRQLKTNSIPILVDMADENKRNSVSDHHWLYQKLPAFCRSRLDMPVAPERFRLRAAEVLELKLMHFPNQDRNALLLQHESALVRESAARALLMDLMTEQNLQTEKLYPSLTSEDPIVLTTVLLAVTQAGPKAHAAKEAARKLLSHPDDLVRYNAACATLCIGGPTNLATTTFETLTRSKSKELGWMAADQLSALRYPSDRPGSPHPGNFGGLEERTFDQRKVHPKIKIKMWH